MNNKRKTIIGNRRPDGSNKTQAKRKPQQTNTIKKTVASSDTYRRPKNIKKANKTPLKDQYAKIRKEKPAENKHPKKSSLYEEESARRIRQAEFERRRKNQNRKARYINEQNTTYPKSKPVYSQRDYSTGRANTNSVSVKKKNPILRILLLALLLLIALFALIVVYARYGSLNPDLSGNLDLYDISSNAAAVASSHRIANVAVFGVDGREDVEGDRSDAIMIGSADFEHSKLKVTSLMRDTYVDMAGEDYFDKLNAAYALGGPLMALKTINENFDTAITDYIVFDFTALVAMVNAVGGVDINVTDEEELYWINQYLMDVNDKVKTNDPDVLGTGMQHLTGSQALAYARIRYTGNGDYDRTQRQRNILEQVVARASAMNPLQQLSLIQQVMPYIETSLRPSELIKYALNFVFMSDKEIQQTRLPADGMAEDGYLDGVSYIFPYTLVDNIKMWYQFVYEIDYTPSARAQEISEEILEIW